MPSPTETVDSSARFDRLLALQTETQATEQHLAAVGAELQELQNDPFDERNLVAALRQFEPVWASLTTREQVQLINLVVEKVGYDGRTGKVAVSFRSKGLTRSISFSHKNTRSNLSRNAGARP